LQLQSDHFNALPNIRWHGIEPTAGYFKCPQGSVQLAQNLQASVNPRGSFDHTGQPERSVPGPFALLRECQIDETPWGHPTICYMSVRGAPPSGSIGVVAPNIQAYRSFIPDRHPCTRMKGSERTRDRVSVANDRRPSHGLTQDILANVLSEIG